MAKIKDKTEEKVPKVVLSQEEVEAIDELVAEDKRQKKQAKVRTKHSEDTDSAVLELRKKVEEIGKLDKESPEYLQMKRNLSGRK